MPSPNRPVTHTLCAYGPKGVLCRPHRGCYRGLEPPKRAEDNEFKGNIR